MTSEIIIEGYALIRLDKGEVVAYYIKHSVAYSYKANIYLNIESIFTEIYLPKFKPFILGIRYRPPKKIDFVYGRDQTLNQFKTLEIQECYLLGDFKFAF